MFIDFPLAWFSDDATNIMMSISGCAVTLEPFFNFRRTDIQISNQWGNPKDSENKVKGALCLPFVCGLSRSQSKILQIVGFLPLIYLLYKEQDKLLGTMYGWKNLLSFILILLMVHLTSVRRNAMYTIESAFLVMAGFVMAAGSDTGFMKVGCFFSAISPIVFVELERNCKFNFFSKGILAILVFYTIFYYGMLFFARGPHSFICNERATLLISDSKKQRLTSHLQNVYEYGVKNHMIFFGAEGFLVQAISHSKLLYKCSFWQRGDDEIEISHIASVMQGDSQCVVFDYTKSKLLKKKMNDIGAKCIYESELEAIYR